MAIKCKPFYKMAYGSPGSTKLLDLFDTHCHLDLDQFDEDREKVIQRARTDGVGSILIPAIDLTSATQAQRIAETNDGIYFAVGVHPNSADEWQENSEEKMRKIIAGADRGKLVAVGEIGLDNYWKAVPLELQAAVFSAQLRVAYEFKLPIIIHCREEKNARSGACSEILLDVLPKWIDQFSPDHPLKERPGVLHSFSGDVILAEKFAALGFYFGFTGPITYKNAEINREVVKFLPSDRILIETDAPFLSPVPHRGTRNEPAYVAEVAIKIAEILQEKPEFVARRTSKNARRFFLGEDH